jgi:hypothetical protein
MFNYRKRYIRAKKRAMKLAEDYKQLWEANKWLREELDKHNKKENDRKDTKR